VWQVRQARRAACEGVGSGPILVGVMEPCEVIDVGGGLRLRAYGGEGDVDAAWPWYRDIETVRLIDGKDAQPYTRGQVQSMYEALSAQGEVYMIELRNLDGGWKAVGDVTLAPHTLLKPQTGRSQDIGRVTWSSVNGSARWPPWSSGPLAL
jgi:hypothetical protein